MTETIIPKSKRFVTITEYQRISGLSYEAVKHMLKSGQLAYITTNSGLKRIDTQSNTVNAETLTKRIDTLEALMKAMCKHLNVKISL